jgi:hypothetical protein
MNETEKKQSAQEHRDGDPKMNVGERACQPTARHNSSFIALHLFSLE